jgi:hypothetical protein
MNYIFWNQNSHMKLINFKHEKWEREKKRAIIHLPMREYDNFFDECVVWSLKFKL